MPFKIQTTHEMKFGDNMKGIEFCRKIAELSELGEIDTGKIIFSDESYLHLKSSPNRQNDREWLQINLMLATKFLSAPLR